MSITRARVGAAPFAQRQQTASFSTWQHRRPSIWSRGRPYHTARLNGAPGHPRPPWGQSTPTGKLWAQLQSQTDGRTRTPTT
eukprot:2829598-Pyramimonas_sp.AAC.1